MAASKTGVLVLFLSVAATAVAADVICTENCLVLRASAEYAAAKTPNEKKEVAAKLRGEIEKAIATFMTPEKSEMLTSDCISTCSNASIRCGKENKDPACVEECARTCRAELNSLSFANELYTLSSAIYRGDLVLAVQKTEKDGGDTFNGLSEKCIDDCPLTGGDGGYNCGEACRAKYVSFIYAMATPAQRDGIYNDTLEENAKSYAIGII